MIAFESRAGDALRRRGRVRGAPRTTATRFAGASLGGRSRGLVRAQPEDQAGRRDRGAQERGRAQPHPRARRNCASRQRWAERGDGAIRARVTEPAGGAHRGGSGIVGIGDGELGRGEDRLAGGVRDLGGGLGEARVLALVIRDDAFEAVIGIEAALAHQLRLVRLDAEAEVHDRIDLGMLRDELEHFGDRVARLAAGEVDRIVAAPARRQLLVDGITKIVGQRGELAAPIARVTASAVTTPQPPAVVTIAVRGPCGSGCVANVAAASNASSTVAVRVMPAWRHMPSKTRSSAARLPVWLAAARCPPLVAPPFTTTMGLRRAASRSRSNSARPSATPST